MSNVIVYDCFSCFHSAVRKSLCTFFCLESTDEHAIKYACIILNWFVPYVDLYSSICEQLISQISCWTKYFHFLDPWIRTWSTKAMRCKVGNETRLTQVPTISVSGGQSHRTKFICKQHAPRQRMNIKRVWIIVERDKGLIYIFKIISNVFYYRKQHDTVCM